MHTIQTLEPYFHIFVIKKYNMAGLQAYPNMLLNHTTMFALNYVTIRIGYIRIKHIKYVAQDQGISD